MKTENKVYVVGMEVAKGIYENSTVHISEIVESDVQNATTNFAEKGYKYISILNEKPSYDSAVKVVFH